MSSLWVIRVGPKSSEKRPYMKENSREEGGAAAGGAQS